ncbi:MAG: radical SAM protein [Deltaproteobacteria bacterium]|nr:radical SAM protein [Deltaproteobacteria bacterium]
MESKVPETGKGMQREPGIWETMKELLLGVRRPLHCIQVGVSSRCVGRCTYCPHTILRERWIDGDMDMDTFSRLWPLMRRSSRVHLQGWGEPLLNPAFFEMTALARRAGCAVSTTTCGLQVDEETASRIVDSGMDIIAFSLAGTDDKSNASRRGISFQQVCDAVKLLQMVRRRKAGVHLEIHFAYLLLASNIDAVRGLPRIMGELGVHAAVVSTLDYIPHPALVQEGFGPNEVQKIANARRVLQETAREAHRLGRDFHWALPFADNPGTVCREDMTRSLYVSWDGSVSPCVYLNLPAEGLDDVTCIFGNVRDENPLEIWERTEYSHFRNRLATSDPDPFCRDCVKRFESVES